LVKKLISALLKKKDSGEPEKAKESHDDVPDELPPLAEDIVEQSSPKESEKTTEDKTETAPELVERENITAPTPEPKKIEDPPEELPSLDIEEHEDEGPDIEIPEDKEEDTQDEPKEAEIQKKAEKADDQNEHADVELPDAIKKAKEAKTNKINSEPEEAQISKVEIQKPETGFFSSVLEHIQKQDGYRENLLAGDLYARMTDYWEMKKHEIKSGAFSTEEKLKEDLTKQLKELKILEQKWQIQKMAIEEDVKFLHEREKEIQEKSESLKKISNGLGLFKNVKPDQYFKMYNGIVLKNLHDLIDALEIMDDNTFSHHVSLDKNDFSKWIESTLMDNNLANKVKEALTKEKIINVLESEPIVAHHLENKYKKDIPSNKYFWLANGVVIKSLYDLSYALKTMDEEIYSKHVSEDKNDFATWIKEKLNNEELAKKLEKAKTKKEMISTLEIYL